MLIITFLGSIPNYYCVENYKYVGLVIGLSDLFISIFYSVSSLMSIYAKFVVADLWERFGYKSFYLNPILRLFNLSFILMSYLVYPKLYLVSIMIARFNLSYEFGIDDFISFNMYDSYIALHLQKYFGFTYLLGFVFCILMNTYIFLPDKWYLIFFLIWILNLITLFMFRRVVKHLKKPSKTEF